MCIHQSPSTIRFLPASTTEIHLIHSSKLILLCLLLALPIFASAASVGAAPEAASPVAPEFTATALTGESVTQAPLLGQTTILVVTPSKAAAADTRAWVGALRADVATKGRRIRDVLAIDLPFFMSESDALGKAREKIPSKFHDQTWLLARPVLEKALSIAPSSEEAVVIVLTPKGEIAARVQGPPTAERIEQLNSALADLP